MSIERFVGGRLEVVLTSADPDQALAIITANDIPVSDVRRVDSLTCYFSLRNRDYTMLRNIAKKRGYDLAIVGRRGIYWWLLTSRHHPVLLLGLLALFVGTLYLPTRILFVRVEGNQAVSQQQILSAAEDCGIRFGAHRREIRSETAKNALLRQIPQLQWVGINTSGCVATISVRERASLDPVKESPSVSQIVAARDGFILSGTVWKGNGLFRVGESVKKGQVLISGYTDCGLCIQATRAKGEILAQTIRSLRAITPENHLRRGETIGVKKRVSILLGKKRINLWKDSGISDTTCDRIYEESYVTLPGGFSLPIAFCMETFTASYLETEAISEQDARALLSQASQRYLLAQMVAGSIISQEQTVQLSCGIYSSRSDCICTEMIGREQPEQIGETHGTNN